MFAENFSRMMPAFRLPLPPAPAPFQIQHGDWLMLAGSCFAEHMGQKLAERKFQTLSNPFGIVYNPLSMTQSLHRILAGNQEFAATELFENQGLWHSWEHHGRFSHPDKSETLANINAAYRQAADFLKQTNCLLLTLGTADVFALRETGQLVANNHKMPGPLFDARRLSVEEIADAVGEVMGKIESATRFHGVPHFQVILTVSPVRHLRMGLVENQRSKARLILACEVVCRQLPYAHYFPAYELLLDDLRDYRFYASDMVHPSEVAVDYIWECFSQTYFSESTRALNARIEKILAAAQHRPFHPNSSQHRAFAQAQLEAIAQIKAEMPALDFEKEVAQFAQR